MNAQKHRNNAQESDSDAFSQIVHLLKLNANVYFNAKVCGNWQMSEHTLSATCFHMVTIGSCVIDVPGHFKQVLHCGDLVIFPRELAHNITPETSHRGKPYYLALSVAQDVEGTGMLCGEMRFQHQGSRYILDALPPVFILRYASSNSWLKSLLEMILAESLVVNPASKILLDKLSELLFTYALRQYLSDHPGEVGMLAIYGHPRLARAAYAIHQHPEQEWTLELLAQQAALSRTSFSETFKAVSGWTPGQYLTWWRMQLAWSLLQSGIKTAEVAHQVGYQSESAFSRVFQKMFSISAGKVRRGVA